MTNPAIVDADLFTALCSLHAYEDEKTLAEMYEGGDWTFSEFFLDKNTDTQAFALLSADGTRAVIAFRGTETDSATDLTNDVAAMFETMVPFGSAGNVAPAVLGCWQSIKGQFDKWLAASGAALQHITLTGHSLGGAIATIAAAYVSTTTSSLDVVTFGAFPVGDKNFVAHLQNAKGAQFRSYLDTADQLITSTSWALTHLRNFVPNPGQISTSAGVNHICAGYVGIFAGRATVELSPAEYYAPIERLTISTFTTVATVVPAAARPLTGSLLALPDHADQLSRISWLPLVTLNVADRVWETTAPRPRQVFMPEVTDTFVIKSPGITPADFANGVGVMVPLPAPDPLQGLSEHPEVPEAVFEYLEVVADGRLLFFGGPDYARLDHLQDHRLSDTAIEVVPAFDPATDLTWTAGVLGNPDGTWRSRVALPRGMSGLILDSQWGFGVVNSSMKYQECGQTRESAAATANTNGIPVPWNAPGDLVTKVTVREQKGYGAIDMLLTTLGGQSSGWMADNRNATRTVPVPLPANAIVLGMQAKEQLGYGIVDYAFGYITI